MRITNFLACLIIVFCLLAWAPGHEASAETTYPLGVALGLSGTGAPYSKEAVEAIKLAVEEINREGGLLGRYPIELFIRDTKTDPKVAVEVVSGLIKKNKVKSIIGTYSSACALAIKPLCRANGVLHVATISNSEDITRLDFSPYTFSVVPNTYMMAKGLVHAIVGLARKKGWKSYATIASDYAWGRSSQEIQVELLRRLAPDLKLAGEYWPPLGETQFNTYIISIMARKPDFLLGTIGGSDNAYFMRDARDYGLFKKVAYPGGLISVSELINQRLSLRRGRYARCRAPFFAHMDVPMMKHFVEGYRSRYGRYPSDWAVMSYDGVLALKQGIERAQTIDSPRVKDVLSGMTIETTRGALYFRKIDQQLSCSAYFGVVADDPRYDFPIYHDLTELKGPQIWRPEEEIIAARKEG